jgi:iron(III) transport system ATP-binding protein
MSGGMPALRLDQVSKRFGDVVAVDEVSLELGPHELVVLVGPSGCGKSTLLRSIAGLQPIDAGTIRLGDRVVDDGRHPVPIERRRVGLVFQEHALFPHLSVADNVAFGVRDRDPARRVGEMLLTVGLERHADRFPHELSGGERQRVALARALAPAPSLMLLDEPFASLDTNLRARVRDDVVEILRRTSTPAVFVTHDQHDALAVGDRVAVMRAGRLVQVGTPVDVFHQPVDRFVASFLGEASYLGADDARRIHGVDTVALARGTTLMVRPDDIVLEPGSGAVVERAEFRGTTWSYSVRLPGGAVVKASRDHLRPLPVGTTVAVSITPGHQPVVVRD